MILPAMETWDLTTFRLPNRGDRVSPPSILKDAFFLKYAFFNCYKHIIFILVILKYNKNV